MHPFVKTLGKNIDGNRVLSICGKVYVAYNNDYIDDAIELASRWQAHQISYERIVHLRKWIQKNSELNHPIPYKHISSMKECMKWVESVIHLIDRDYTDEDWEDDYYKDLEDNIIIFSL